MDKHPTFGDESPLITKPRTVGTSAKVRRKPVKAGQLGKSTSYTSDGENLLPSSKPNYYQLVAWDEARRKEPIISDGLSKISLAIQMKIGEYSHPNKEIEEFVVQNLKRNLYRWINNLTVSALWSGIGVSEIIYSYKTGPDGLSQVWLEDLVSYNPLQIQMKLNHSNRLTHGEKLLDSPFLTGIWVPTPYTLENKKVGPSCTGSHVRLPKGKFVYININDEGNNPWGSSIVESVLEYHLFKEAYRDMLAIALDRYGTPLVWIKVPNQQTSEMIEGLDGEMRAKWLHEKVSESLADMRSEAALVLTQTDKDHPVEIGSLTTGNNFADSFNKAIDMCDQNMLIGLGIPNLIIRDGNQGLGSSGSSERQVEMFHSYISSLYKDIIGRFLDQCVLQLIQYNFDPRAVPHAYDPGSIYEKPLRWSEAKVLLGGVETLTNLGYMSPEEPQDLNHAREILNLPRINRKPKLAEVVKKASAKPKTSKSVNENSTQGESVDV